jgi:NADH-ubiquinone oxidoreductase chain 2
MGLVQSNIKRLYAYSTISHLGYMLLSLLIYKLESLVAFSFYLIQYSISNLNAFMILILIGYNKYIKIFNNSLNNTINDNKQISENSPVQYLSQLKGYLYENPILCISFCFTLLSFIGIPPLVGFFGKQAVLSAALKNKYVFITLVAIITSAISAAFYLKIIKIMTFNKTINEKEYTNKNITISNSYSIIVSIITLLMLTFMLYMQNTILLFNSISLSMFNI